MFPKLASCDSVDGVSINAVFSRQVDLPSTMSRLGSYLGNLLRGQFGGPNLIPSNVSLFLNHIGTVVLNGSKKQMIGIDASRVVALVKHPKIVWNWASMDLPRKAMGANIPNLGFAPRVTDVFMDNAISVSVLSALKNPARFGFKNLAEKFFIKGNGLASAVTLRGAINVPSFGVEVLAALGTLTLNHMKLILSMVRGSVGLNRRLPSHFFNPIKPTISLKGK